ncbi:arylformamidase [Desulfofustis glycolicus DSM 9705]|uniref:Kynurenine formamidase n=2 Tax=Desulfofustis glycolicus TaxID=51195 RepID=A0A1M5YT68_9BACT|nr:arylformamidase [Desulfofustis glycolicus DSM 9705]
MVLWPGSPRFYIQWVKRLEDGQHCNASVLHCDMHAGTHIDAPLHYLANGKDIAECKLNHLCGSVYVAECKGKRLIGPEELKESNIPKSCHRLLLRTDNSKDLLANQNLFDQNFCALSEEGAIWITERNILLVGIDYLSIQPFKQHDLVHSILLESQVLILEGLNLNGVELGWWELFCLPLLLPEAEASPARAILRRPIQVL